MDIYEIRRNNLRAIVESLTDGTQARLAERLNRPPNLISRYLKNKKIGDDFARHVEESLDLHRGSLDTPFTAPLEGEALVLYGVPVTKESVDVAHELDKLPREMQLQVAQLVHTMVKHHKLSQRQKVPLPPAEGADATPPPNRVNETLG